VNNPELDEILKSARAPKRTDEYWRDFPQRVSARLHWQPQSASHHVVQRSLKLTPFLVWSLSLAIIVVAIIITTVKYQPRSAATASVADSQLAEARKCYHELEALFPNQIEAIVFDQQGPRMVLADKANVPDSAPIYLRICGPRGCEGFVTFSGQQISFNGENCEVLSDAQGRVILVGDHQVWTQANRSDPVQIQATLLNEEEMKGRGKAKI
jgi:hypothetical protein